MKGLFAILGFLILMIGFGIFTEIYLSHSTQEMLGQAKKIEKAIEATQWAQAQEHISSLKTTWEEHHGRWSMLIDHHEMEDIETTIRSLEEYAKEEEKSEMLVKLAELEFWIGHIPQIERVRLENIF